MTSNYWSQTSKSRLSRRRLLGYTAGGAAAAAFLAACGGSDSKDSGGASGKREPGGLVFRKDYGKLPDETSKAVPGGLMPVMERVEITGTLNGNLESGANTLITDGVYESLARRKLGPGIEFDSPGYKAPEPSLASSWEVAPGGLQYTFKMRKGVKFHNVAPVNGREMDIDDVKASIQSFSRISNVRAFYNETVDRLETPDSETLVFHLKKPYGLFLERGAMGSDTFNILPKELSANPELAATRAIGTGYRMLNEWKRDISWNYSRHETYWGGKPFIERWRHAVVPEFANRRAQFMAKQSMRFVYDFVSDDQRDALQLRKDAPEAVMIGDPPYADAFMIHRLGKQHTPTSPWSDERIRIGLRRAVNYEAITNFLAAAEMFAAAGIDIETSVATHAPPDPSYWLDPRKGELGAASENYLYNVAEAKKLFEAAGHKDGFTMPLFVADRYVDDNSLILYKQEIEKFGLVKLNVRVMPYAQYYNTVLLERSFDGVVGPNRLPAPTPDYFLSRYVHAAGGNAPFQDAKMDTLVDRYRQETDRNKQIETLKEYQRYAATKFYEIPAQGWNTSWTVEWPWLHNPYNPPYPSPVAGPHLEWLDEGMPNRNG